MKLYLYGMICGSTAYRLPAFPKPDEYTEIEQCARFVGGETGTCAAVLSALGADVRLDGTHIGRSTAQLTRDFYRGTRADLSALTFDPDYDGLEDCVLIAGETRSPLGRFAHFFGDAAAGGKKHWNEPQERDVQWCDAAALDACFGADSERAAEFCVRHGKPYVTVDCKYDSELHRHAAVTVISGEALHMHYGDVTREEMLPYYTARTDGLTVITNGGKPFFYGRRGASPVRCAPFRVHAVSTLGAGDTFKAGCTYALAAGMSDEALVRFASACAAVAVSRFPSQLCPPTLGEVQAMAENGIRAAL